MPSAAISASALTNKRDILTSITPKFENTMFLAGYAALIAVPLAVGMGIVAAINEGKWIDRVVNIISLAAISVPEFFIGYLLIFFFAVQLGWFPSLSTVFQDMGFAERIHVVALPAVTLTMLVTAHMLRMTRSSVLAIMSQPYIEMAFLKGLTRTRVIFVHALPNAAAPIITVIALNLAYLIVGVVVIETVFVYPGIGQFMVDGVTKRDLPVIQACGLVFAGAFIIAEHGRRRAEHPRQPAAAEAAVGGGDEALRAQADADRLGRHVHRRRLRLRRHIRALDRAL